MRSVCSRLLLFGLFAFMPCTYADESYQLLRDSPDGYSKVLPGAVLDFPEDHLPHKDYRIEWWYLTANLNNAEGDNFGVHWTLFRMSLSAGEDPGGWSSNQVWMSHTAVSTEKGFAYEERFARGGIGQAGVTIDVEGRITAQLDDWLWQGDTRSLTPGNLQLSLVDPELGHIDVGLDMATSTPWVLQGDAGYSQKSARGQASYYYSQPHINVTGNIQVGDDSHAVAGKAWLDREWSSQPLAQDQPGWDWFSLHFDDGTALMVYRLRQADGNHWLSGSWVTKDGQSTTLKGDEISMRPVGLTEMKAGATTKLLPLSWDISIQRQGIPALDHSWRVVSRPGNHWLNTTFPYWEGPVTVTGTVSGKGYLELTGY